VFLLLCVDRDSLRICTSPAIAIGCCFGVNCCRLGILDSKIGRACYEHGGVNCEGKLHRLWHFVSGAMSNRRMIVDRGDYYSLRSSSSRVGGVSMSMPLSMSCLEIFLNEAVLNAGDASTVREGQGRLRCSLWFHRIFHESGKSSSNNIHGFMVTTGHCASMHVTF
jgi:hypothetical protein